MIKINKEGNNYYLTVIYSQMFATQNSKYTEEEVEEPILLENENRFVLFPIRYHEIYGMYKKHLASFWTPDEIDLTQDLRDWEKLNQN